ncbi:MAG TPA: adenylate/guanylate cyclase domain-containing protein [Candidatus Binataceae bacterium]|nr:adenylate/guanylate cyclase domain-containing protein [Candidatus Binataceae bacterium]
MRCPVCACENPANARFCIGCGAPLSRRCAACATDNPPAARFCLQCGAALDGASAPAGGISSEDQAAGLSGSTPAAQPRTPHASERRHLTVLFCDLVGSTEISTQLDPEDLRRLIEAYQRLCGRVVNRFEGHVAQYLGDGIVVYFGYPAAHEDDVQRAVRAGLAIIEQLPQLHAQLGRPVHVRIGIHTGLVVVGEMGGGGRREELALGDTPNIAARVQALADPDTVLITEAVQQLVRGLFECEPLGARQLKGVADPLAVHRVVRETGARNRFEAALSGGLTPLVGRDEEVALLGHYWEAARRGDGRTVTLSAEAGLGKSRLAEVVKEQVAEEGARHFELRCSPYYQNSAFYPVIDFLQRILHFDREHEADKRLRRLERTLRDSGLALDEAMPVVANLLSLPLPPERYPAPQLSPQRQREKTLQVLVEWVRRATERGPLLLISEDLHWADASTVELLSMLVEQAHSAPLLLLFTARPEFAPPWSGRPHATTLTLSRLADAEARTMAERVAGGELPAQVARLLAAKSDGVPLYVEELTKNVLESGILRDAGGRYELSGPLPALAIPATLQDSLMARLDRLSTTREVAQLGSVLGREFSYELLRAVSGLDQEALEQALANLVGAEILFQHGTIPQARYVFKHALLQDAAYESVLKSTRQRHHQRVATVLDERFPEIKAERPELLAHHYTRGGLSARAIPFWHAAGQRSIERSANIEALSHLGQALELLEALAEGPERDQQELGLQIALGVAWMAVKGYSAPELEKAYGRALAICEKFGESPQTIPVMMGLWAFYLVRGDIRTSEKVALEALELADRLQVPALQMEAHLRAGISRLMMGWPAVAREHLERALALWVPDEHRSHALIYGQDPGMAIHAYLGWAVLELGLPDTGLRLNHEALEIANRHSHPLSAAFAWCFITRAHLYRKEFEQARRAADEMVRLSIEQDFPLWAAGGRILGGMAAAELSPGRDTIDQLRQAIDAWFAVGAGSEVPLYLTALIRTEARLGNRDAALAEFERALKYAHEHEQRAAEADLLRLRGEVYASLAAPDGRDGRADAEASLKEALDLARARGMKLAELRTANSLARLWIAEGRHAQAHAMLAELYGAFTEGFELADFKEARALLENLARRDQQQAVK